MRTLARFPLLSGIAAALVVFTACTGSPPERAPEAIRGSAPAREENRADTVRRDSAGVTRWSYRLTNGWLSNFKGYDPDDPQSDSREYEADVRAECRGEAMLKRCPDGNCWTWKLRDVRCTGKGDASSADWLHDEADSASVCRRGSSWGVSTDIPGRGVCSPKVTTDARGQPARVTLSCTWACRDPEFPCRGAADYELVRSAPIP